MVGARCYTWAQSRGISKRRSDQGIARRARRQFCAVVGVNRKAGRKRERCDGRGGGSEMMYGVLAGKISLPSRRKSRMQEKGVWRGQLEGMPPPQAEKAKSAVKAIQRQRRHQKQPPQPRRQRAQSLKKQAWGTRALGARGTRGCEHLVCHPWAPDRGCARRHVRKRRHIASSRPPL